MNNFETHYRYIRYNILLYYSKITTICVMTARQSGQTNLSNPSKHSPHKQTWLHGLSTTFDPAFMHATHTTISLMFSTEK